MANPFLEGFEQEPKQKEVNPFLLDVKETDLKENPLIADLKEEESDTFLTVARQRLDKIDFMNFLNTPVGQYYAEIGTKLHADYFLKKAGVPETFPIDPKLKYPPHVLKLAEISKGNMSEAKDRLAFSLFLDGLAGKGYTTLRNAVAPMRTSNTVANLSKLSDEALDITNQELKRLQQVKQLTEKGVRLVDDVTLKAPQYNVATSSMAPDEAIIGGVKYKNVGGQKPFFQIKIASKQDKLNELMSQADIVNNPDKVIKEGETIKDLLPPPGSKDPNQVSVFARGIWSYIRSPQYYAPKVYDIVGDLEKKQAQIRNGLWSQMKLFEHLEGKKVAKFAGAVADGHDSAEEILSRGLLGEEGTKLVDTWRNLARSAADLVDLPEEKRVLNYLTRVWDDVKHKDIPLPRDLELFITENKKFLKARKGEKGYNLDIIKAARLYTNWVAKHVATKEFKKPLLDAAEEIAQVDPIRSDMANKYILNYFGELNKAFPKKALQLSKDLKRSFASGTIAWNLPVGLLNMTQSVVFGAAKIGYGPFLSGVKKLIFGGKKSKEVLKNSGILEDLSKTELEGINRLWSKVLPKPIMDHQFIFMQGSESFNKGTIYLGAYSDVLKKMKYVERRGVENSKKVVNWLQKRGVDVTKTAEDQAHKYGRRAAMETQIDLGRGGQNLISMNPFLSTGWMYMNFPFRMAEFILSNSTKTLKYMLKNPFTAFQMPETRTTMRLALTAAMAKAAANSAGVSVEDIVGVKNFVPMMVPMWQAGIRTANAFRGLMVKDPTAARKLGRGILTLTGMPLNALLWKVASIIEVAFQNKDNKSDQWIVRSRRTGKPMYKVDPLRFILGEGSNIVTPQEEEDYYKYMHERNKQYRTVRNLNNQISLALEAGEREKAAKLRKEAAETRRKLRKREQLHRRNIK